VDVDVWLREASALAFSVGDACHKTNDGTRCTVLARVPPCEVERTNDGLACKTGCKGMRASWGSDEIDGLRWQDEV